MQPRESFAVDEIVDAQNLEGFPTPVQGPLFTDDVIAIRNEFVDVLG
jgi:hypothetical protein